MPGLPPSFFASAVARVSVVSGRPYRRYLENAFRTGLLFGTAVMRIALAAERRPHSLFYRYPYYSH